MVASGEVVAILASGPSMTPNVVAVVRKAGIRSIVTNGTFRLMPDANALFAADVVWWQANTDAERFRGEKYVSQDDRVPCAIYVKPEPPEVGGNSALRAAQMAEKQGATVILLFGVDLNDEAPEHWHSPHGQGLHNPTPSTFRRARNAWAQFSKTTKATVLNCNPDSALECFPKALVEELYA